MVVKNDNKPLQKFLNRKNANNKVNHLSLELATYNLWMDFWCMQQSSRLPFMIAEVPENDATT